MVYSHGKTHDGKIIERETKSFLGNIGIYSETQEIGRAPVARFLLRT
jgi:hypothetical protein